MKVRTPERAFAAASPAYLQSCSYLVLAAALGSFAPLDAAAQTSEEDEIVVTAPLEGSRIESLQGADILLRDDIRRELERQVGRHARRPTWRIDDLLWSRRQPAYSARPGR